MDFVKLMRPHQWIKNFLVFLPLFLSAKFPSEAVFEQVFLCFVAFCLASSCIYIINDIFDVERDRAHPIKKKRPLAAGVISVQAAWMGAGVLAVSGFGAAYMASLTTVGFVIAYVFLNIVYSVKTKHVPLVDCLSISLGFCLRFMAGGAGFGLAVTPAILLTVFFGAYAMALLKRRIELSVSMDAGKAVSRPALKEINLPILDSLVSIFTACSILLYAVWCVNSQFPLLLFSLPPFALLWSRIFWLAYLNKKGEDFSKTLLQDLYALVSLGVTAAVVVVSLYLT